MRFDNVIDSPLLRVFVAVICLLACCGIGRSMTNRISLSYDEVLSHQDSLIQEMVEFIHPECKLTKVKRKHIENRIKGFPQKVIRRDTTEFFLNTAYAIAYYEFYRHDYKKARRWIDLFDRCGMTPGLLHSYFHYSSVGLSASNSINAKGKFKSKKDKNDWWEPITLSFADSVKFDGRRTPDQFIDTFLDDVPMDCSVSTYRVLLTSFKDYGGRLEWLNGYSRRGFVQRCVDAKRSDILGIVYGLWNVVPDDFSVGSWGYLEYRNKTVAVDSVAVLQVKNDIISFDPKYNKVQIDSLIAIKEYSKIAPKVMRLLSQYYDQSRFIDLVEACETYNQYLTGKNLNTLHNYWALALSNIGNYEAAILHYDTAIANTSDPAIISTMRLNKGSTLGEMGRTDEAIAIFMSEKERQKKPFDRFCWNDNLGYVYSFVNPVMALFYYNEAEKFIDSSTLYKDRKVRHYCRKARTLSANKYLQRKAIEDAMRFTRKEFCSATAKGVAFTELAAYCMSAFDYQQADKYFRMAYQCFSGLTPEDQRLAYLNLNYAQNLCNLKEYNEAIDILYNQLNFMNLKFGNKHSEYIKTLSALLRIVCKCERPDISIDSLYNTFRGLAQDVNFIDQYEKVLVDIAYLTYRHDWENVLQVISSAIDKSQNPLQTLELCQIYESVSRDHCSEQEYHEVLSTLIPEIKQSVVQGLLLMSGNEQRSIQEPLSSIINGVINAGDYDVALELSLFRKGLLFATQKAIEKRLSVNRKTRKRFSELQTARTELNAAIAYNDTVHIPELAAFVSRLDRELRQSLSANMDILHDIDKNTAQVTSALSEKSIAVEFIKFQKEDSTCYGAFIIGSTGLVKFKELGTEQELTIAPHSIWDIIQDIAPIGCEIYFCTDGLLSNMGLEYFNYSDGKPISQSFRLHRVFHLSDIKPTAGIGSNPVLIGISDHNSPIGAGETVDRGSWTDLPDVKYEIQQIAKTLQLLNPMILFNDNATETIVKGLSGSAVTALHITTHGFYRGNDRLHKADIDTMDYDHNIARRILSSGREQISGLVLRGGNLSWQTEQVLDDEDNLLTADEIEMMNFPNLELTVLSACETGIVDIDSEGVWGLQRAFRIAGTKSLICSLTKVEDYWTAQFMDAFYEQAAQGNSIYDSFHAAREWLQRELPDSPEIWSSFILIE